MAGDWIKMRNNLWDDPRVSSLCDLTDSGEAAIVGGLYWLWASADEHTEDGYMPGLTTTGIDRKTGIKGFGAALIAIGWVKDTEGGVTILNFEEHNGTSAKRRCTDAQRKANVRIVSASDADKDKTSDGQKTDECGAREEKRREVKSKALVPSAAGDHCPHQEIIALYHEVLPQCPQIRDWTPARATQLRARWNENEKRQTLEYWKTFFEYVKGCDFLVGKTDKPFFADLEWLTKSGNFTKVREGKYENK